MKILLAIDDSDFSKAAVDTLIQQVRPENAEVHVMHVVESIRLMPPYLGFGAGPAFPGEFTSILEDWRKHGQELVAEAAARLQAAGFKTTTSICDDDAKNAILSFAEEWHAGLIVVGSHGRKGIDRFLLGSVSDALARHAHCSVMIVRSARAA